jgi:hypothetical protein
MSKDSIIMTKNYFLYDYFYVAIKDIPLRTYKNRFVSHLCQGKLKKITEVLSVQAVKASTPAANTLPSETKKITEDLIQFN